MRATFLIIVLHKQLARQSVDTTHIAITSQYTKHRYGLRSLRGQLYSDDHETSCLYNRDDRSPPLYKVPILLQECPLQFVMSLFPPRLHAAPEHSDNFH